MRTLTQTDAELTPNDRAALAGARSTARAALRPEQIDAKAGDQVLDRLNYREVVVAEALDSLHDGARRYDDAFREAAQETGFIRPQEDGTLEVVLPFKQDRDYQRSLEFYRVVASMIAQALKIQRLIEEEERMATG